MNKKAVIIFLFLLFFNRLHAQQIVFNHYFAPTEDYTKPVERPYRDDICLNGSWQFYPVHNAASLTKKQLKNQSIPQKPEWEITKVKVPSPWNVNGFAKEKEGGDFITYPSYPKDWDTVRAGWLMRKFSYKKEWKNKRLILHFDAVAGFTQVFINGQKVGENFDMFLPFEIDITDRVKHDSDNELMLWVADADLFNEPGKYGRRIYVGGSFWGQYINGIWQNVYLLVKPPEYVKSSYIQPLVDKDELNVETIIKNTSDSRQEITVSGDVMPWINLAKETTIEAPEPKWKLGNAVLKFPLQKISLAAGEEKTVELKIQPRNKLKLWSNNSPDLYALIVNLIGNKDTLDKQYKRFGWRQFKIVGDQFYLNGKHIILKGDSWHFMGIPEMTRRYAWAWFTTLKNANANAIRLHAQPYPSFYLDMADEMGMFVLDETGLWASDGGPKEDGNEYWKNANAHLKRFILRDRNHPSVFGWSVCNENIPVTVFVHHSPDSLIQKQLNAINGWVNIAKQLDSTRNWISGDGETGKPTDLPTIIGHYGDENAYKEWSSQGKLWGIGESGMAYYGTPKQTSAYNGNRSYVSQEGRMEGVADEAVHLINGMKKYNASYRSVFNIVWYGLKPLELGLKDTTAAPTSSDGIFFPAFVEDKPGVQPERLGPYTSTLNPGYDSSLPLYKTWPLFDAIKKSFATSDSVSEYQKPKIVVTNNQHSVNYNHILLFSSDPDKRADRLFKNLGIDISNKKTISAHTLVILDGKHPPADNVSIQLCKSVTAKGGTVLIVGADSLSGNILNQYLPYNVKIVRRKATSFIKVNDDLITNNLSNADFYFCETADEPVSIYGIAGDFVQHGKVILTDCNTDWKMWNNKPEYSKTISTIRSEREEKAAGNILVASEDNKGKVYFLSADPFVLYHTAPEVLYKLLFNLGAVFNGHAAERLPAINSDGVLQNAMLIDSTKNKKSSGKIISVTNGIFNFNTPESKYISFWVYSPRSLVNLLAEPDMPVLNINIETKDTIALYINKRRIDASQQNMFRALPLEKGWNHFVVKINTENNLRIQFNCNQKKFLKNLGSVVSR